MHTLAITLGFAFALMLMAIPPALALRTAQDQGTVVGHLTHVEGNLLRYVTDDDDWVQLVKDSPVGAEDLLFAEEGAKAEIIIPNNTWIRTGGNARLHILRLENDTTRMDMDSGLARFYNKSANATIEVSTPFGRVLAPPLTAFDMCLKADSVQMKSLEGTVIFSYLTDHSTHAIKAGEVSCLAGFQNITGGGDTIDKSWDAWNREMDEKWEDRLQDAGEEQNYLPATIRHESYALRENGIWETVYYEGTNCSFWRPRYVPSYWSPYTVGRWTVWYGDHCWIPYEPFGYVTHHYGNWIYIDSCSRWYWAPPDCHQRRENAHFLDIPFAWYPGRVSWIHRGAYVGWIPLAPYEPYYSYRNWGPLSRVVAKDPRRSHKALYVKHCRYKNHAVIVDKSNLYRVTDYSHKRIYNRPAAVIDNFQRESGINSRVINNFKEMKQRFTFDTRNAKKLRRPAAGNASHSAQPAVDPIANKKPTIRKIAVPPGGRRHPGQKVGGLPIRTKPHPDKQITGDHAASAFEPVQRYRPDIAVPGERIKLPATPERKQRMGVPGEETSQVLPQIKRRLPSAGVGISLPRRDAPRTPNVRMREITPRQQAERSAIYNDQGSINRTYFMPKSTGSGGR